MVLGENNSNKEAADKIIYELNFKEGKKIQLQSANKNVSFNILLKIKESVEDSPNIYTLRMEGSDPEGLSQIEGFASFK